LDPAHSELGFKIKHLMISNVSGKIQNFSLTAVTKGEDFSTATVVLTADMSSITTNNEQRDAHLRNADFFSVEQYPELKFEGTKLEKLDEENYTLYGNLSIRGITHPVQLQVAYNGVVKDPWGAERAGFVVSGKIKRSQWGISFNSALETGGLMLGEEVNIQSEIELLKQDVTVPA